MNERCVDDASNFGRQKVRTAKKQEACTLIEAMLCVSVQKLSQQVHMSTVSFTVH